MNRQILDYLNINGIINEKPVPSHKIKWINKKNISVYILVDTSWMKNK